MTDEMAQELSNLPRFSAHTKIIKEEGGRQSVWKGKIETYPLSPETPIADTLLEVCVRNGHKTSTKREDVEKEIRKRQEQWRWVAAPQTPSPAQPPPTTEPPPKSE